MKHIYLTFLFSLFTALSYSQSMHGFTTGIDTIAQRYNLKSRLRVEVRISKDGQDTSKMFKQVFDSLGFIIDQKTVGYYTNSEKQNQTSIEEVTFEYNEDGYLIAESLPLGGPINVPSKDTIVIFNSKTSYFIGAVEYVQEQYTEHKYPFEPVYNWKENYHYNGKGQLVKVTSKSSYQEEALNSFNERFLSYDQSGLLQKVVKKHNGKVYRIEFYSYTFFD